MDRSAADLRTKNLRRLVALLIGALLAAASLGVSPPAAAFGLLGYGHGVAVGGPRPGAGMGVWRRGPPFGLGAGPVIGRPGWGRGPGFGSGAPPPHHPIGVGIDVGGGAASGGLISGGGTGSAGRGGGSNSRGSGGGAATSNSQTFVPNEVITAFAPGTTPRTIAQLARRYDLTQVETQNLPLISASLYRWRIGGGRTVAGVIRALGAENAVASVQPNYIFTLQDEAANNVLASPASSAAGDPAQYVLAKLQCAQAQAIAVGRNVVIAVIDSTIEAKHPDLVGSIVMSFDALGEGNARQTAAVPHAHGTAIAGAIAAHGKLLGIAPGAHLLAIRAFDDAPGAANGTSFTIDKALQWAANNGARIVNMSFAGPADPMLARLLAAAYGKGIVLIAAAGNGGPRAAPLYPAADPNVIAVTATDSDDHLFAMANRGRHIAVAAPGVDILALAPGDAYALSTGTSIAAAHVSGVAALLLEHRPALKPADIRNVLIATAKPIGSPQPDSPFGAGLANAYRAVSWLDRGAPLTAGNSESSAPAKQ